MTPWQVRGLTLLWSDLAELTDPLSDLLESYKLSVQECQRKITEVHLQEIARSCCKDWKWLGPYLKINKVEVNDIDSKNAEERDKRLNFLHVWVEREGSDASYYRLINALLKNGKREDAEFVCALVQVKASPRRDDSREANRASVSSVAESPVIGMSLVLLMCTPSNLAISKAVN